MELLNKTKRQVIEAVYTFQDTDGSILIYKEWLNEEGIVIDSVLRSKNGWDIDNPALMEQVQIIVSELESNS